ncbi:MAG: glycine--tRNA ligase subunit beta [Steroidobacterales bacterium]
MSTRELLFELRCEELPPVALPGLAAALKENILKGLDAAAIRHGAVRSFATPRRLAVSVARCALRAPDRSIERRGPPLASSFDAAGAPTQAAAAFARSCGVAVDDLLKLMTDKGAWLMFRGTESGAMTAALLPLIVNQAVAALPSPRRMRWGAGSTEFIRPVHGVVLLFGAEVIDCEVLGMAAGRVTVGHRFHAPRPIGLRSARSYERALLRAKVVADFGKRRESILAGVTALAAQRGARALIDAQLLDEVTALVEWPVPIAGHFEPRFLALPREVVIATIQDHQRYFPVERADGTLSNEFVTVSNIDSRDPAKVRAGNERVIRPRLSDAAFFWDQDRKVSLDAQAAKLSGVTFQARLGSYADKGVRVRQLAEWIGASLGAGPLIGRTADLAKADLMSAMVGEFPELQGTMGRHYAAAQGEPDELCVAIEEQYLPRYAGDVLPASKLGMTLALADKIDTLVGIFAIEQRPTGARDPFGLRRAALGVLRILLERHIDLDLVEALKLAASAQPVPRPAAADEVYAFIAERLRALVLERGDGTTAEMLDAVLILRPRSPLDAVARLQALHGFLRLPEGAVLAAANKRIANLLKKAEPDATAVVQPERFVAGPERQLHAALAGLAPAVEAALRQRQYGEALGLLATLRAPIDTFFDQVMVMDEDPALRHNRLALLRAIQMAFGAVADLSRLPG